MRCCHVNTTAVPEFAQYRAGVADVEPPVDYTSHLMRMYVHNVFKGRVGLVPLRATTARRWAGVGDAGPPSSRRRPSISHSRIHSRLVLTDRADTSAPREDPVSYRHDTRMLRRLLTNTIFHLDHRLPLLPGTGQPRRWPLISGSSQWVSRGKWAFITSIARLQCPERFLVYRARRL